jgi:MraZ protein
MILSEASEDSCDKQGRVTIPSELLRKTKIDKDVLILGILDRIELWNPDEYQQRIDDSGDSFESIAESIMFDE